MKEANKVSGWEIGVLKWPLVLLAVWLCTLALQAAEGQANLALDQRISRERVFSQGIIYVGNQVPVESDSSALWSAIETMRSDGPKAGLTALEGFINAHPDSAWTPSLRANLAKYYRERGRYTPALQHWQAAWLAVKDARGGNAKLIGDFVLAHWTRLLGSLGNGEQLEQLFQESESRQFDDPQMLLSYHMAKDAFARMSREPGIAYRCGTYALHNVGLALKGTNFNRSLIIKTPSPPTGFAMSSLLALANKSGLSLVPAKRESGDMIPIPSVIHWRQNHYAAILAKEGNIYKVVDPTFERTVWMTAETINSEASGNFMVQRSELPKNGWRLLTSDEMSQVVGRGYSVFFQMWIDCHGNIDWTLSIGGGGYGCAGCGEFSGSIPSGNGYGCCTGNCPENGGPGLGPEGEFPELLPTPVPANSKSTANNYMNPMRYPTSGENQTPLRAVGKGMPVWSVSEPFLNLWVTDTPLYYHNPLNKEMRFRIDYKQSQTREYTTNSYNFGRIWHGNVGSYVLIQDANDNLDCPNYSATLFDADGSEKRYLWDDAAVEFYSRTQFERILDGGAHLTGLRIRFADGSLSEFSYLQTNLVGQITAFQTKSCDVTGNGVVGFNYKLTNSIVQLIGITDALQQTNIVRYNTNSAWLVSEIESPFGSKAIIKYNNSDYITNIVDMIGLGTAFAYDSSGSITNMSTPYGDTAFSYRTEHFSVGPVSTASTGWRAIEATQPNGGKHLFIFRSTVLQEPNLNQPLFRYGSFEEFGHYNTFDTAYWGPRQFLGLSTNSYAYLTDSDFKKARHKLWKADLADPDTNPYFQVAPLLLIHQSPSSDGVNEGQKAFYSYDSGQSAPRKVSYLMPDGKTNVTEMIRDGSGHITNKITTWQTPSGSVAFRTNYYTYSTNGIDLLKSVDANGNVIASYSYNSNHQVCYVTNAAGALATYGYRSDGQLDYSISISGAIKTNSYDANGYLEKIVLPDIGWTNMYGWSNGLVVWEQDDLGARHTNTYDRLERLTGTTYDNGSSVSNIYCKLDLVATKDRINNWQYALYDSGRRLIVATNAVGDTTRYGYCVCGQIESLTNALGLVTTFFYDNANHLTQLLSPDGTVHTLQYDSLDRVTRYTDPIGHVLTNYYNMQGLLVGASNAFGQLTRFEYNALDWVTNRVDASGFSVNTYYDALGRVLVNKFKDGSAEGFAYSDRGLASYTNQLGLVTGYLRSSEGRILAITNASQHVTLYDYNARGLLKAFADTMGHSITNCYDNYGRVTNKIDSTGASMLKLFYNAEGQITNRWTPEKGNAKQKYSAIGILTNVIYDVSPALTFSYDALGRLTNMVDEVGQSSYKYDALGRLIAEDGPWGNDTIAISYAASGERSSVTVPLSSGRDWTQSYQYDAAHRLTGVSSPAGIFNYEYPASLPTKRVQKISIPGGSYVTNLFDSMGRLTNTALVNNVGYVLNQHSYSYNLISQKILQQFVNGNYVSYSYDTDGQIILADGREQSGALRQNEQLGYSYGGGMLLGARTNGNLVQAFINNNIDQVTNVTRSGNTVISGSVEHSATNVSVNDQVAELYADKTFALTNGTVTNGLNVLIAKATNAIGASATSSVSITVSGSQVLQYDQNGNLISDGVRGYVYNDENQLTAIIATNAYKRELVYDGRQRLRITRDYGWSSGVWVNTNEVRRIYDGCCVVQERDGSNRSLISYTRGADMSGNLQASEGVGGLLARSEASTNGPAITTHAYFHFDGSGNVSALVNPQQVIVGRYRYDPYGRLLMKEGLVADRNTMRFSCKESIGDDLYYYGYRTYSADLQRWISRDPIYEVGGLGIYTFCGNDPINNIDRLGLDGATIAIGGVIEAGGTGATIAEASAVAGGGAIALMTATAVEGYVIGNWIGDQSGFQEWLAAAIAPIVVAMAQSHGERGTGGQGGSNNPFKHCKPNPASITQILCKDPQTGKWKIKPRTPEFDEYWKCKHPNGLK